MLGFLLVVWGRQLQTNFRTLRRTRSGRALMALLMVVPLLGMVWVGQRVVVGRPGAPGLTHTTEAVVAVVAAVDDGPLTDRVQQVQDQGVAGRGSRDVREGVPAARAPRHGTLCGRPHRCAVSDDERAGLVQPVVHLASVAPWWVVAQSGGRAVRRAVSGR